MASALSYNAPSDPEIEYVDFYDGIWLGSRREGCRRIIRRKQTGKKPYGCSRCQSGSGGRSNSGQQTNAERSAYSHWRLVIEVAR